jgi:hypothetical protein
MVGADVYSSGQDSLVNRLLEHSVLTVACVKADDDALVGWAAFDPERGPTVHYAYVTEPARRQGICRMLLTGVTGFRYTHLTDAGQAVASRLGGIYDPFLLMR